MGVCNIGQVQGSYFPFVKSISIASSCATGLVTGLVQKHNCHLIMIRNEVEVRVQIVQVY